MCMSPVLLARNVSGETHENSDMLYGLSKSEARVSQRDSGGGSCGEVVCCKVMVGVVVVMDGHLCRMWWCGGEDGSVITW